jgi:YD repeat-containing protein
MINWNAFGLPVRRLAALLLAGQFMLLAWFGPVHAGVNTRNGNFYISYTDLIVEAPEFKVARTYNSRSTEILSFGRGWGWPLDTVLRVNGDGTITVVENGSGLQLLYVQPRPIAAELELVVEDMLRAMEGAGWIMSAPQRAQTRQDLLTNAETRRFVQNQLIDEHLIARPEIPLGARLESRTETDVVIVREPSGFYRARTSGFDRFNLNGQLIETRDRFGTGYKLRRNENGHLREIILNGDIRLQVETDDTGLIEQIVFQDQVTRYKYDSRRNLIHARNVVDTVFEYQYDPRGRLTHVLYENGTMLENAYDPVTGYTIRQDMPNGEALEYEYFSETPRLPDVIEQYGTITRKYRARTSDAPFSKESITYQIGIDMMGNQFDIGIVQDNNGQQVETRYHPCGKPTFQRRGTVQVSFDYDAQCRLTFRNDGRLETRMEYDLRSGKISRVADLDLFSDTFVQSDFQYDVRGNLINARNSDGEEVGLIYDEEDRISTLIAGDGAQFHFDYDARAKPVRIALDGVGAIDVIYDAQGEILSVNSDAGQDMALRITQGFQALLALVKPAGLSLSF